MTTTPAQPLLDEPDERVPGLPGFLAAVRAGWLPAIPDYLAAILEVLATAERYRLDLAGRPVEGLAIFARQVVDSAVAGEGFPADPDEFAEGAHRAFVAAERQAAVSNVLPIVLDQIRERVASAIAAATPEILAGLRTDLEEVLSAVRAADQAIGAVDIADPEAVAAASGPQREALLALRDLTGRYNRVRHAQRAVYGATAERPPGYDGLSIDHTWKRVVYDRGLHEFADVRNRGTISTGGPRIQRLRQVSRRHDAWLPDLDQLATAMATLNAPEPVAA